MSLSKQITILSQILVGLNVDQPALKAFEQSGQGLNLSLTESLKYRYRCASNPNQNGLVSKMTRLCMVSKDFLLVMS